MDFKFSSLEKKKNRNITTIISFSLMLVSGCSYFGDEELPYLNTRVEEGMVILGSDPVIDNANNIQKDVKFVTRDNVLKPLETGIDNGFDNKKQAYFEGTTSDRVPLRTHLEEFNQNLLASMDFGKGPNKANIGIGALGDLMNYYAMDMEKYATDQQLATLKNYAENALRGNLRDQEQLADFYLDGFNGQSYEELAVSWYILAANQGSAYAGYMLSILYQLGVGLPQDLGQSVTWYKRSSGSINNGDAKIKIAKRYLSPTSLINDSKQAFVWMESAAEQGEVEAQYLLADMYLSGKGVEVSPMNALTWYGKAAEQNSAYAQYSLGVMFYNGQGIEQNLLEAKKYLEYAAWQGHNEARFLLSRMYEQGFGVEKSLPKAYAWLQMIPRENIVMEGLDEWRANLIAVMTPDEKLQAQKELNNLRAKSGIAKSGINH